MLSRDFYQQDANALARALLGKKLVHKTEDGISAGVIVETEAYCGGSDKGAHAYGNKRTSRTVVQFGPGGYAYIYLIYGMHCCLNIVANQENTPECVLIRALEPVEGIALMQQRRGVEDMVSLCNGPGKLCQAMAITRDHYGADLCGRELWLEEGRDIADEEVLVSPRINIDFAEECKDLPWRYFVKGSPYVSKVQKKYRDAARLYRI